MPKGKFDLTGVKPRHLANGNRIELTLSAPLAEGKDASEYLALFGKRCELELTEDTEGQQDMDFDEEDDD